MAPFSFYVSTIGILDYFAPAQRGHSAHAASMTPASRFENSLALLRAVHFVHDAVTLRTRR
jgi:hypothetical protein